MTTRRLQTVLKFNEQIVTKKELPSRRNVNILFKLSQFNSLRYRRRNEDTAEIVR